MTNLKKKNGILKGAILLLVLVTMLGGILSHALTAAAVGTEEETYTPNVYFDYREALTAPTAVSSAEGTYYVPTSYLYYGRAYQSSTGLYIPILNRVLDPSKDNAGGEGAVFVLSESVVNYSRFSPYSDDSTAAYLDDENSYVDSNLIGRFYNGIYTAYETSYVNSRTDGTLAQELDYIRPITKTDAANRVDGYFGFEKANGGYYWTVVDADGNDVESLTMLENSRVFPLSVEEVYNYVGTNRFSNFEAKAVFSVTDIRNGTLQSFWLRTAVGDIIGSGSMVGIVDDNGQVTYSSAQNTLANRNAFNIEVDDIAFVERVSDNAYRLAFNAPEYKTGAQLEATVYDVKDGVVTVEVKNHIGQSSWSDVGESLISFIVTDSDGKAKYYGVAEDVDTYSDTTEKIAKNERFRFNLPDCYEQGDRIKVFWERKAYSNQSYTTYVSNMVDIGCIHITEGGSPAYCHQPAICGVCHQYFGDVDDTSHRDVVEKWIYNDDDGTHSRHCVICEVAVYTEACSFGSGLSSPTNCIYNKCNGCGHEVDHPTLHDYDENGICSIKYGEYHYEMPALENYANIGFSAKIATVGEWNALAEWYNSGGYYRNMNERMSVILTENLDFSSKEFIPIGTEARPAKNLDVEAHHRTISGIDYTASGNEPVGIIAVGENIRVFDLIIENSVFNGASYAGAVVGKLLDVEDNKSSFNEIAVINVRLEADLAGGIVGAVSSKAELSMSFIYNVTSDGANLDFSYDGNLVPTPASDSGVDLYGGCYRLADENNGVDAFTEDEFASGIIAYRLRQVDPKWRQTIGTDNCPWYALNNEDEGRVYKVVFCNGDSIIYMNENIGQVRHGDYIDYDESSFEWVDGVGAFGVGFSVSAKCGACEEYTTVTLEAEAQFYESHSKRYIARSEFNAYLTVNCGYVKINSEPKVFYSTRLEDFIGMTPMSIQYDGNYHYASVLFDNLRDGIEYGYDFDAYFLDPVTGEKIATEMWDYYGRPVKVPDYIQNVGIYDVVIVGVGGYEGYEYKYEDVFEIKKSSITLNPLDINKVYDGTTAFELEYELLGDEILNFTIDISLEDAPSAEIGRYTLKVVADLDSHAHGDNLSVTLARDTVQAVIAPNLILEIENISYPESFTYGDEIITPSASHFSISTEAGISYQWFEAGYDYYSGYYPQKEIEAPKNAGDYILRVYASSVDGSNISNIIDVPVQILPRRLTVELIPPENAETVVKYENEDEAVYMYILEVGERFSYEVSGFANGESLESAGIKMEIFLQTEYGGYVGEGPLSGHPQIPLNDNYKVTFSLTNVQNYESDSAIVYVSIDSPDYTYPIETEFVADGEAISPNIVISGPCVDFTLDGEEFAYYITVKDQSGNVILTKSADGAKSLEDVYLYNAATVTYYDISYGGMRTSRGVFTEAGEYTVITEIRSDTLSHTYEYSFVIEFSDEDGSLINEIVDVGIYTVRIYTAGGNVPKEATIYAQQKLVMDLKPHEYNISEGTVTYDPRKVMMEAGNVINLEHTLVEVYFDVREYDGKVYASGVKVLDKNGRDISKLYSVETYIPSWPSHTDEINICHIFDNPCDPDCNISGCEYKRAVEHTGGVATCQKLATCDFCGLLYGNYSAERHVGTDILIYPNLDDLEVSHLIVYSCCGGTKETVAHTHIIPATCTERAVCSECGWTYGELDPTNHSGDERSYEAKNGYHTVTHLCCGLAEDEAHVGGIAYCNSLPICEHCNAGYGLFDPENHANSSIFVPDENDETSHNEIYECCGMTTKYSHLGGDATCNARAVCADCLAEYGELEPDDHASEEFRYEKDMDNPSLHDIYHACCDLYIDKEYHSGGIANCQSPALCELCGNGYGDKDYSTHASDEYAYYALPDNEELHVKVAACCGEFAGNEEHTYGEPTCTHASRCVCGKEQGEMLAHVYDNDCDAFCNSCGEQTRAATFHVGKDGKPCETCGEIIPKEPITGGGISAIVTASSVAASAGGFSLFWFVIKKKSLAELLAIIKK